MFSGHYDHWILSRMNGIQKYVKPGFFQSKTLLELGGGYAHVGNKFHELGALVTTSYHHYDWEIKETKTWRYGLRRFWICWKKTMVPDFLRAPE